MPAPWQPLLDWWFGDRQRARDIAAQKHRLWFGYRASQDEEARQRFGELSARAVSGALDDWAGQPEGWLALLILLDQIPRMTRRGNAQAFAGDEHARAVLERGLANGFDRQLTLLQRVFCYLVLEHHESPISQDRSVTHFAELVASAAEDDRALFTGFLDYARRHRSVVGRFGRFPHRNAALGRESTGEECAFLARPGSRF